MPIQFDRMRQDHFGPVVRQHAVRRRLTAVEMLAENHLKGFGQDLECTQVKYLVLQRAQHQAVGLNARSVRETVVTPPVDLGPLAQMLKQGMSVVFGHEKSRFKCTKLKAQFMSLRRGIMSIGLRHIGISYKRSVFRIQNKALN